MSTARMELRISAGPGPAGARRFVAALVDAIGGRLADDGMRLEVVRIEGARRSPRAVVVAIVGAAASVGTAAQDLVGTHRTVEAAARRGTRRRWFAAITLVPTIVHAPAPPAALEIRCVRARGPGGQNVNRRATAVQIRDPKSGAVVRCDEHRTQARNRAAALQRVSARANALADAELDRRRTDSWLDQRRLTARDCVMHWRSGRDGALVLEPGG